MKKSLKKVILTCSAVAALMIAMSASAMAASTATAAYDSATTKATVTVSGAATSGQVTLLVLKPNADGTVTTSDAAVTETAIAYIDQTAADANGAITFTVPLSSTATSGVYLVKVGGEDGSIAKAEFDTSTTPTPTYTLGDVNADTKINISDVVMTVDYMMENIDLTDNQFKAADTNKSNSINITDVVDIVDYMMENPSYIDNTKK